MKDGNILITEETNPINRIVRFQLIEGDKILAGAEISSAGGAWIFDRIFVSGENRSRGYGSEVLKKLAAYLDRKNIDLYAYIYSTGSLGDKQLEAWYRRYGFTDASDRGCPLARYAAGNQAE